MKELRVSAIENGTVIDHIPVESVFKLVENLGVTNTEHELSIAANLPSKRLGRKGIIKISKVFLSQPEIDKIALLAEGATLSIIKNYAIKKKQIIAIPKQVVGIAKCFNPNCITNNENSTTRFEVTDKKNLKLRCHYCERTTTEETLEFK